MKIRLAEFGGMAPKIEPRRLADKLAVDAENAAFGSGALGAAPVGSVPSTDFPGLPAGTRSILRPANSDTRLAFSADTSGEAFASLVAPNDTWGRIYYTTAGGPRFTSNDLYTPGALTSNPVSYKLGMKTPTLAAIVASPVFTPAAGQTPDLSKVAYVFTFVDKYGHEGAPSPVSTIVELPYDLAFSTRLTFTPESLPDTNVTGAVRRVYRAAYDGSTSRFQFIADVPYAQATWDDTVPLGEEGESIVSTDWVPPPVLKQMVPMASNFAAGFYDNYLCYSELRLPHAWPENYQYPLKYRIVGLKPTQNGLLVATTGKPYWAFGADPASAIPVELAANYPCLSANSLVDMGDYVVFATFDGLVAVAGQDVKVITGDFVDRRTWLRDFAPDQIVAFAHEGQYVFSVGAKWWAFDPAEGGGFTTLGDIAVLPTALRQAYYDVVRDTTVLLNTSGVAHDVVSIDGTSYRWKSKDFETPPVAFGAARVLSTQYPVEVTVESDGIEVVYSATSERPFRLSPGLRATVWSFTLAGTGRVTELAVAQSPQEFV
jgi:hypothetical protein